ncbi:helix-turn-helix transcriptional regulator [Bradyrhizobium sp. th.b2]|uniref:helix-turn-helix domain-containing protein n=1 Tax=Bradyrhizobium sp. th-b2 TaxID=172088 RepID=UPI0004920237
MRVLEGIEGSVKNRDHTLTAKEVVCLRWCKEGKTNWEIGEILSISEKTVEFHLGNSMRKLGASNRITAVMVSIKRGFLEL